MLLNTNFIISEITDKYPKMNVSAMTHEEAIEYYIKVNKITNNIILRVTINEQNPITSFYDVDSVNIKIEWIHPFRLKQILKNL
ncbi:MAG: hypothetical protein WC783_04310 [Candidatus Paceibacterota bacterium]|jgi:hypothetical protein